MCPADFLKNFSFVRATSTLGGGRLVYACTKLSKLAENGSTDGQCGYDSTELSVSNHVKSDQLSTLLDHKDLVVF